MQRLTNAHVPLVALNQSLQVAVLKHDFGVLSSSRNRQFAVLSFSQCDHTSSKATVDSDTSLRSSIWVRVFSQGCLQVYLWQLGIKLSSFLLGVKHPYHNHIQPPFNSVTLDFLGSFIFSLSYSCLNQMKHLF